MSRTAATMTPAPPEADVLVVGCGLTGSVTARQLAEHGMRVAIIERRDHIGGNVYDYRDEDGLLLQKYGPHSFFTNDISVKEYVERFVPTQEFFVNCTTNINGRPFPMPFNFRAIDMLYPAERAEKLKRRLLTAFPDREVVSVREIVEHSDDLISAYGRFMYENEYRLYTAKQWGRPIEGISPAVFERVPVYLSYKGEYEPHKYQFLPQFGFTDLVQRILDHQNISYTLCVDVLRFLKVDKQGGSISWNGWEVSCPIVYTGALDELFGYKYGRLPYRSLEFIWKKASVDSVQETVITAWPQESVVTRVTEYTKLPCQTGG